MHFFGPIGVFSFLTGLIITFWIIGEKIYKIHYGLPVRDVVDQPMFFMALLTMIIGTLLFIAGFLAEMISRNSPDRNRYVIEQRIE